MFAPIQSRLWNQQDPAPTNSCSSLRLYLHTPPLIPSSCPGKKTLNKRKAYKAFLTFNQNSSKSMVQRRRECDVTTLSNLSVCVAKEVRYKSFKENPSLGTISSWLFFGCHPSDWQHCFYYKSRVFFPDSTGPPLCCDRSHILHVSWIEQQLQAGPLHSAGSFVLTLECCELPPPSKGLKEESVQIKHLGYPWGAAAILTEPVNITFLLAMVLPAALPFTQNPSLSLLEPIWGMQSTNQSERRKINAL